MNSTESCKKTFKANEIYLMNTVTGSVDTKENWLSENSEEVVSSLIKVTLVNGDWVEVDD